MTESQGHTKYRNILQACIQLVGLGKAIIYRSIHLLLSFSVLMLLWRGRLYNITFFCQVTSRTWQVSMCHHFTGPLRVNRYIHGFGGWRFSHVIFTQDGYDPSDCFYFGFLAPPSEWLDLVTTTTTTTARPLKYRPCTAPQPQFPALMHDATL